MVDTAIVGAGPYGLSVAAHFRSQSIPFRIFGRPMDSWRAHMPKGMLLKSDGFASNIYDPAGTFTLKHFCAERGIEYSDLGVPVRLNTFSEYGLAFKERMVPELEDKLVTGIEQCANGFRLRLDDGEVVMARRVVLAVGITHFEYVPPILATLPGDYVSHSFRHHDLEAFSGRDVAVVGGGSSATDIAGLLYEHGAQVRIIARRSSLKFHERQEGDKPRSLWQRIRRPKSGLGPGLWSKFFSDAPWIFHYLPQSFRLKSVRTALGPAGGWFAKEKVVGRVPLQLGTTIQSVEVREGRVRLQVRATDGHEREIWADHVIAATGYKVDLDRLNFLSSEIRSGIKTVEGTPVLSSNFESSLSGLYFVGIAAANSFGPLMRFAYGAGFAARTVARAVARAFRANPIRVVAPVLDMDPTAEPQTISKKTAFGS